MLNFYETFFDLDIGKTGIVYWANDYLYSSWIGSRTYTHPFYIALDLQSALHETCCQW